ncbi:MAG: hypothetical protein WA821_20110 [Anaerolineales bacterium]
MLNISDARLYYKKRFFNKSNQGVLRVSALRWRANRKLPCKVAGQAQNQTWHRIWKVRKQVRLAGAVS